MVVGLKSFLTFHDLPLFLFAVDSSTLKQIPSNSHVRQRKNWVFKITGKTTVIVSERNNLYRKSGETNMEKAPSISFVPRAHAPT